MTDPVSARGIDHVGITVPDIDAATAFFVDVFDAVVLYDSLPAGAQPNAGRELERRMGVPGGTQERRIRMLRLGNGPGVELFEFTGPEQQAPARPCDFGLQHLALYVDDPAAMADRVRRAGGEQFGGVSPLPGPESGEGNEFVYCRAPWGTTLELLCYPTAQPYEESTVARRWRPAG